MMKILLVVALVLALVAIYFLCRQLRKLQRENKNHLRTVGMWRKIAEKAREVEKKNSRLFLENTKLSAQLGAERINDVARSFYGLGQDSILDANAAHEILKEIAEVYGSAKKTVADLYNEEGRFPPASSIDSMSN